MKLKSKETRYLILRVIDEVIERGKHIEYCSPTSYDVSKKHMKDALYEIRKYRSKVMDSEIDP